MKKTIIAQWNREAFDFVTKPVDFTDLELTIEKTIIHVHQIRKTLKAIKENIMLKMYVDETVINFMDTREFESSIMASETIEATVVFIDICGFTSISENETPDTVVKLLNSYFDVMVKEIIGHEGFIDKFIGDVVNTASRLESAAMPGQITLSKTSYEKVKEYFNCQKVGEVSLKNKSNPMIVYEVIE